MIQALANSQSEESRMTRLTSLATLAMLLASAMAAPLRHTPTNENKVSPSVIFKRDAVNDCGDSSFENQTTGGSPAVEDCLQIAANIAGGGTWEVEDIAFDQHQLVQYKTCALGVTGVATEGAGAFLIGNQDIIDLINSSIDQFQWNGLVGAKGYMTCIEGGAQNIQVGVEWGVYHT